ncbi:hypothetical protein DL546_007391 [Coniochaeta pulveracea]|uniref:Mitochondrial pyruvate carrier n=1 Tax=Coniochaeta pulveracea TaxID=177199 RepID=A0A420YC11_9PEZI|nr:hypothetical protein DL546_007391 [Coniochaeta pulveracea]
MSSTSTVFRATRTLFRPATGFNTSFAGFHTRQTLSNGFRQSSKRWQSSTASDGTQQAQSWFKRMWDSPIGLKTVHFWAPVMKWALVLAGVSDFARPAEKLSLTQNGALTATGLIWTRWCLIIKPKNYLLAAVNFFLGIVGMVQCGRILAHQRAVKNQSLPEQLEAKVEQVKEEVKDAVKA